MKKIFSIQIVTLLIFSGGLGGMLFFTDVYDEVYSGIVSVLCLSCLKLEPKTKKDFTFEIASDNSHPDFVLNNLLKGPIFLHFSGDACLGCEIMDPLIKQIFNIDFQKDEMINKTIIFEDSEIVYFYNNLDNTSEEMKKVFDIYDKEDIGGVPMFTVITLGYDHGIIRPYYVTLYGTLNKNNDVERISFLREILQESIEIYEQNKEGYSPF